jgi:hypothetical protein
MVLFKLVLRFLAAVMSRHRAFWSRGIRPRGGEWRPSPSAIELGIAARFLAPLPFKSDSNHSPETGQRWDALTGGICHQQAFPPLCRHRHPDRDRPDRFFNCRFEAGHVEPFVILAHPTALPLDRSNEPTWGFENHFCIEGKLSEACRYGQSAPPTRQK